MSSGGLCTAEKRGGEVLVEGSGDRDAGLNSVQLADLLDELIDGVVSDVLREVTDEMDRMSIAERAELLAQVLREAGV